MELVATLRTAGEKRRLALNHNQTVLGVWEEPLGRFVCCAGALIGNPNGQWGTLPELTINGERLVKEWEEVTL